MENSDKSRGGRPSRKLEPGERVPLSFRVTPELKEQVDQAARQSGRSISQEMELRLQSSFDQVQLATEALKFAYGEPVAALVIMIARAFHDAGYHAGVIANTYSAPEKPTVSDWFDDPYAFEQAARAVQLVLEMARPQGDPSPPKALDNKHPGLLGRGNRGSDVGVKVANTVIRAATGEHVSTSFDRWGKAVTNLLGPHLARRINRQFGAFSKK